MTVREIRPRHEFQSGAAQCTTHINEVIVVGDDRKALRARSRCEIREDRCTPDAAETPSNVDVQTTATRNFGVGIDTVDDVPG